MPENVGISFRRQSSSHALTGNQSAGFLFGLSNPTPPVRKNRKSISLISSRYKRRFEQRINENSNLSFSNNDLLKSQNKVPQKIH